MIHEEICTYEVAKLAKEKGFDVPTRTVRVEKIEGTEKEVWDEEECRYITQWETRSLKIPTQSLLQRWLREEKGIVVEVFMDDDSDTPLTYSIHQYKDGKWECVSHHHGNYYAVNDWELCLEDALKYALENLI